jgi:hypothetical protein
MKCGGKMMVGLAVGLAWTMSCSAVTGDSTASGDGPYRAIVDRNVFDLKPIPPPAAPQAPSTPPPNVKLIGLMMISGHPQGVFQILDSGPGKTPANFVLAEEQRQETLEVKSIDYAAKKATVQIGDDVSELKLEEPKAIASVAAGAGLGRGPRPMMPGGRGAMRGGFVPQGGFTPGGSPGFAPASGGYNPATPSASYNPGIGPGVGSDAGGGTLPTRPVRTDTPDEQPLTAEQQILQIEAQREQYLNEGNPIAQILPPTPLTQALQKQREAAAAAAAGGDAGTTTPTPTLPPMPGFTQPVTHGNYQP